MYRTVFSSGIEKIRNVICKEIWLERFNDLEEGEIIDMKVLEDINFYKYLHKSFKTNYLIKENNYIYSITFRNTFKS